MCVHKVCTLEFMICFEWARQIGSTMGSKYVCYWEYILSHLTKNTDMYTHETIIAHNGIYGSPHESHVTIRLFTSHVLLSRLIGGVQRPPATIAIVEEKLRYCRQ